MGPLEDGVLSDGREGFEWIYGNRSKPSSDRKGLVTTRVKGEETLRSVSSRMCTGSYNTWGLKTQSSDV